MALPRTFRRFALLSMQYLFHSVQGCLCIVCLYWGCSHDEWTPAVGNGKKRKRMEEVNEEIYELRKRSEEKEKKQIKKKTCIRNGLHSKSLSRIMPFPFSLLSSFTSQGTSSTEKRGDRNSKLKWNPMLNPLKTTCYPIKRPNTM